VPSAMPGFLQGGNVDVTKEYSSFLVADPLGAQAILATLIGIQNLGTNAIPVTHGIVNTHSMRCAQSSPPNGRCSTSSEHLRGFGARLM
jgi:hypothetical protein